MRSESVSVSVSLELFVMGTDWVYLVFLVALSVWCVCFVAFVCWGARS